ncbi:MAG: tetraspanin family protein [Bulleidia sp.]|nr:tetraspanin family protein [Bulleidia sp.]
MEQTQSQQSETRMEYSELQKEQPDDQKEMNLGVITADAELVQKKLIRNFTWRIVYTVVIAALAVSVTAVQNDGGAALLAAAFLIGAIWLENWLAVNDGMKDSRSAGNVDFIIEEGALIRKQTYEVPSDESSTTCYEATFAVDRTTRLITRLDKELYDRLSLCDKVYIAKRKDKNGRDVILGYYPESEYFPSPEVEPFVSRPLLDVSQEELEQMVQDASQELAEAHEEQAQRSQKVDHVFAWMFLMIGIGLLAFGLFGIISAPKGEPDLTGWLMLAIGALSFAVGFCGLLKKKKK